MFKVKGKGRGGIDVKLSDETGAVSEIFERADEIGSGLVEHAEFPGGQADLSVLVRVATGEKSGA